MTTPRSRATYSPKRKHAFRYRLRSQLTSAHDHRDFPTTGHRRRSRSRYVRTPRRNLVSLTHSSKYGNVHFRTFDVIEDRHTGVTVCKVRYLRVENAEHAIDALDGRLIGGTAIRVLWAHKSRPKGELEPWKDKSLNIFTKFFGIQTCNKRLSLRKIEILT